MRLKPSMFNTVEKINGRPVLFNCRTHAVLKGPLCERLLQNGPEELLEIQRAKLRSKGILVPEDFPEAEALQIFFLSRKFTSTFIQLSVVPTYRCNCACPDCPQLSYDKSHVMDEATREAVARLTSHAIRVRRTGRISFWLAGGEPFTCLDPSIALTRRIRAVCEKEGVDFEGSVTTNGTLLRTGAARPLVELLDRFYVSLAASRQKQQQERPFANGKNSYDAVLEGLQVIAELGKTGIVRFNISSGEQTVPQLRETIREIYHTLGDVAYPGLKFEFHMLVPRPECAVGQHIKPGADSASMDELLPALKELSEEGPWPRENFLLFESATLVTKAPPLTERHELRVCDFHKGDGFYITPLGDLWACSLYAEQPKYRFGRVTEHAEIFANTRYLRFVNLDPFDDPRCRACRYLPFCLRRCPITTMEQTGTGSLWSWPGCDSEWKVRLVDYLSRHVAQHDEVGEAE